MRNEEIASWDLGEMHMGRSGLGVGKEECATWDGGNNTWGGRAKAYYEVEAQNQQCLQQATERDDCNIKESRKETEGVIGSLKPHVLLWAYGIFDIELDGSHPYLEPEYQVDFVQRLDSKVTRLTLGDAEVVAKGQNTSQVVEDLLREYDTLGLNDFPTAERLQCHGYVPEHHIGLKQVDPRPSP
nr:hypothetical protein [Tanacetum cinerariifolium]